MFDYTVKETETAKDLRLMQMDRTVQAMVKSTEELQKAIDSPGLDIPRGPRTRTTPRRCSSCARRCAASSTRRRSSSTR